MKKLAAVGILALLGFGAGLLSTRRSSAMLSQAGGQAPAGPARVVPLMAVYDVYTANLDGSDVLSLTYVIAVRKDGSRAMISTDPVGKGWLKTRSLYDPGTKLRVDIHDDLGIKTTWPGQNTDQKSTVKPRCPQLPGSQTIELLGHRAVQDWHLDKTRGAFHVVLDNWRVPDLGCLEALSEMQTAMEGGSHRKAEERLVWLSETDPPDSFFEVSPELEEVSPLEEFQHFIRAGLVRESSEVPPGMQKSEIAYAFWNGKIQRPEALRSLQQIQANAVPGQP